MALGSFPLRRAVYFAWTIYYILRFSLKRESILSILRSPSVLSRIRSARFHAIKIKRSSTTKYYHHPLSSFYVRAHYELTDFDVHAPRNAFGPIVYILYTIGYRMSRGSPPLFPTVYRVRAWDYYFFKREINTIIYKSSVRFQY